MCARFKLMKRAGLAAVFAILGLASMGVCAQVSETLRVYTEADGNILDQYKDGKITGLSGDLLSEALTRAKVPYQVFIVPWKRALETARREESSCAFTAVRTDEREKEFKWVGPLQSNEIAAYALSSRSIVINTLDDLKKYRIAGELGEATTETLLSMGIPVDYITGNDVDTRNLNRLKMGRVDLWLRSSISAASVLSKWPDMKVDKVYTIKKRQNYMMCNLNTQDATIAKLNNALRQMSQEGVVKNIFANYGLEP